MTLGAADGGWRAIVRRHRLFSFGSLVVLFTLLIAAADLGRDTTPYALVFVPAISALIVAGVADDLVAAAHSSRHSCTRHSMGLRR